MSAKKKSKGDNEKLLVLEGRRLIEDAFDAGIRGHSVFFSQKSAVQGLELPENCTTKFYKVPFENLKLWSTLTTCPGITGIFRIFILVPKRLIYFILFLEINQIKKKSRISSILFKRICKKIYNCSLSAGFFKHPKSANLTSLWPKENDDDKLPINLVCDNIRDPGNMGSILRAAAGAGCNQAILTQGNYFCLKS